MTKRPTRQSRQKQKKWKTMYVKNRKWTLQYKNPIARPVVNHLISYNAPRTMTKRPMKQSWQRNPKKWWKQWMQKIASGHCNSKTQLQGWLQITLFLIVCQ
jgi:hypothetical protein